MDASPPEQAAELRMREQIDFHAPPPIALEAMRLAQADTPPPPLDE